MKKLSIEMYPASVTRGKTFYFTLEKGECIYAKNLDQYFYGPCSVACEWPEQHGRKFFVTDFLRDTGKAGEVGFIKDSYLRHLCESRGANRKEVPGGVTPIAPEGTFLIADYAVNGTGYYILPMHVMCQYIDRLEKEGRLECNCNTYNCITLV